MLPNKRHGVVVTVGLALVALAFVGPAAADPGVSLSADGDAVDIEADSGNGSLTCTFATSVEENRDACQAEGPVEMPNDGDDGGKVDPNVDATVGPDGVEAEAGAGDGELSCGVAPPEEGEEPEAPCEATAPDEEQLPEDEGNDEDDGGSTNVEFQGSVGEDGFSLTVGNGEDGVACVLGPDYAGEEPPCERLGGDGGGDGQSPEPPEDVPADELPTDELPSQELPQDHVAF
jgi:hypothetical protein